ncbi:MAG: sigma factor-like helix-turn-helix DNA-binding protein, partial [Archangium sp.]
MAASLVTHAVSAWPALRSRRAEFEQWLSGKAPKDTWGTLNLEDLGLSFLALAGEAAAVAEVERRLQRVGRPTASRRGDDDFVDEVLQQSRSRLLVGGAKARLNAYRGQGALVQYLKAVVTSVSVDLARTRKPVDDSNEDDALEKMSGRTSGAESRLVHLTHRAHFTRAFKAALSSLSAEERTWLRMRFVDGLSIDAVGTAFGVHRTTAMRWLEKAQATLLKETRRHLADAL